MAVSATYPAAVGPTGIAKSFTYGGNPDGTTAVDILDNSAGTRALKVEALNVCTDNSASKVFSVYMYVGSTAYLIGAVSVPALSGTDGTTARVNVLTTLGTSGADGVPCLWIPAGAKLQAKIDAALASGKTMWITGRAINFADN